MIHTQNWGELSAIQIGGVICMPVLMIGQTMIQHYGFASSIAAVLIGNAILFFLGLIAAKMSVSKRRTTMENAIEYFGEEGVKFFSLAFVLSLVGWFAIQLNMMTLGVMDLFSLDGTSIFTRTALNVGLGILITLVALYGVRGISILANLSLPLLIATIGYAAYSIDRVDQPGAVLEEIPFTYGGISLVIAMAIAFVIDLPTYYRHAKTVKHAYISIAIVFGLCLPLLEIIGIYLAAANPDGSFLDVFKRNNSMAWNYWTATFLILAGWTTNNVNLYSGVVCMDTLMKNSSVWFKTLAFGAVSTALSCVDLLTHIELVLEVIGISIGSMGGLIFTRYLLAQIHGLEVTKEDHPLHLLAWAVGILVGLLSWFGYSLTGISVLDATFAASLATMLVMTKRRSYEKTFS